MIANKFFEHARAFYCPGELGSTCGCHAIQVPSAATFKKVPRRTSAGNHSKEDGEWVPSLLMLFDFIIEINLTQFVPDQEFLVRL